MEEGLQKLWNFSESNLPHCTSQLKGDFKLLQFFCGCLSFSSWVSLQPIFLYIFCTLTITGSHISMLLGLFTTGKHPTKVEGISSNTFLNLFLNHFASMFYAIAKHHNQLLHSKLLVNYFQERNKTCPFTLESSINSTFKVLLRPQGPRY